MLNIFDDFQKWNARRELNANRADFYYDLATSLDDRIPLFTTLRKFESRARERRPSHVSMYLDMLKNLRSGALSLALKGVSSDSELLMIDSLQNTGDKSMADGLRFLASTVEKTDAMVAAGRKAFVYPLTLLLIFGAMLIGFSVGVVPILTQIFPPEKWPPMGQALYTISSVLSKYWIYIVLGLSSIIFLIFYSFSRWTGKTRLFFDRYFPYSFYRDFSGAMLIIALSSLMRSGISLRSSLERSLKFSSPWMRWHLRQILINLSQPASTSSFGVAFRTGVLSRYLEDRVQDASERSNPVESFVKIGVGSIDRVIRDIEGSASKVNNIMLAICGMLLAFMMAAFFATAMDIQNNIGKNNQTVSTKPIK